MLNDLLKKLKKEVETAPQRAIDSFNQRGGVSNVIPPVAALNAVRQPGPVRDYVGGVANAVVNNLKPFGTAIGEAVFLNTGGRQQNNQITNQYFANAQLLADKSRQTTDPEQRRRLYDLSQRNLQMAGGSSFKPKYTTGQILGSAGKTAGMALSGGVSPSTLLGTAGLSGLFSQASRQPGESAATAAGRGFGETLPFTSLAVNVTSPALTKLTSNFRPGPVANFVSGRIGQSGLNVAEGIGLNSATGIPNTPGSVAFDAAFGLLAPGFRGNTNAVRNFRMSKNEMEILVESESILRNPEQWVDINLGYFPTPVARTKAIEQASRAALQNIRDIGAVRLPNASMEKVNGDPFKMIKELVDLNKKNKLANTKVPGLNLVGGEQARSYPKATKAQGSKNQLTKGVDQLEYAKAVIRNNTFQKNEIPYYMGETVKKPHGIDNKVWKQAAKELGFNPENLQEYNGKYQLESQSTKGVKPTDNPQQAQAKVEQARSYPKATKFSSRLDQKPLFEIDSSGVKPFDPSTAYIDRNIEVLNKNGIKVNSPDDVITLYHGTSVKNIKGIEEEGLRAGTYLATDKNATRLFAGEKGKIIEVKVPVSDLGFVQDGSMAGSKGVSIQLIDPLVKGNDGLYYSKVKVADPEVKRVAEAKSLVKADKDSPNIGFRIKAVDNGNRVTHTYVPVPLPPTKKQPQQATQRSGTRARQQLPSTQLSAGVTSQIPSLKNQYPQNTSGAKTSVSGQRQQRVVSTYDSIIQEGRASIGKRAEDPPVTTKQALNNLYTQFVDRYNPISRASAQAKKVLKTKGATLRPEADPDYMVRRLTGAGGIADTRFRRELDPVLKEMENLKIDKTDMDVYLAHKRMAGFGDVGREIYGADPAKSKRIVAALEAKYGGEMGRIADKLYKYQDKGFQEMVDAGFISPEDARLIREQNPDYSPLYRVMDLVDEYLGVPTRKTMQGSQPIQRIKGSNRQIESPVESIIGNTFRQRAAIEKNAVAKAIVNLQRVDPSLGFTKVPKAGADTVTVWNGGKKEYWRVGQDIADVAKGANEESMNLVLKLMQKPASILRQGATGRNPEFMIPNIIRDQLDAGISSKYGYIPFVDYFSGLKSMLTNDEVYRKWESSGAKIDLGELSGKKEISQMFDEKTQKRNLFGWLTSGLDVMGKYSEQPTRVGLFKKAYNATGNEALAMMESRDATVDFARMGTKMRVANSIVPFLNVGVQGFDKLIRSVKDRPAKVLLTATAYGVAPAVATTLYNLTNFPEEYAQIPQYDKDSNFVLVKGRNEDGTVDYLTFPKGNVIPSISNPVQSFIEYAYGQSQRSFSEMALNVLSDSLPVLAQGSTPKEVAIKTIGQNLPQVIKPAIENLMNKSFYKYDPNKEQSKEIVPYYLQSKPAYKQDYKFTPVAYKKIGALLNVSPLQVQNLLEGYFAGYVKIPTQLVEIATDISNGRQVNPNDKTLLRRFVKQTYPTYNNKPQKEAPVPGVMDRLTDKVSAADSMFQGELPTIPNDIKTLYEEAQKTITNYPDTASKIRTGLTDNQTLEEAQLGLVEAQNLIRRIEQEQPEQLFKIQLSTYGKDHPASVEVEDRARWAVEQIQKTPKDKQKELIKKLWDEGVITGKSNGVAQAIEDEYGINVWSGNTASRKIKITALKFPQTKVSGIKIKNFIPGPDVGAFKIAAPPTVRVGGEIAPTRRLNTTIKVNLPKNRLA